MKLFKTIWSFISPLADIVGILGFLGVSIKNINFNKISWFWYIVLIISSIFVFMLLVKKIKEIQEIYKNTKINEDLEKIGAQKNIQNIKQALPSTKTLLGLYKKTKNRINNWSDDSIIKTTTLYLQYSNGTWEKPHIQVIAYSKWKNEEGWFYEGGLTAENFNENEKVYANKPNSESIIFFKINQNWQVLVKKAFNAISNKVTNYCQIRIDEDSIRVTYYEGKIEKDKNFKVEENFTKIIPY